MSADSKTIETKKITKVLVANRGEIAVRVIRAAKDAGIPSVAVYAEPDAEAPFVHLADEAFALGGQTSADSYLNFDKILDAAKKSGANAIHPGYGFLSENGDFAEAVENAGLIWIGPSPDSIRKLGDKVTARHIALAANAPMAPGTEEPVKDADEVVEFAKEHGLPIAIKAAFGGGGRGMKVAHNLDEVRDLYDSAVRESMAAFGRSECFVERYLDKARHVECQVVADMHGNYVVVSTRDCSLQRRFQKLVEEAPAPFLTDEQNERLHQSAKDICREAGYYGAGTVEYMVADDGLISFLEVNTRLQVEHPVSEEVTGWDLVQEQFRIAEGKELSRKEDPIPNGHAIEFRINGEDPGSNFMPAPGTVTKYVEPSGPGVRMDSGINEGEVIGGQFDSMLAKLIVWGKDRDQALARSARALDEYQVEGLATVIPFDRHIVKNPAFVGDGSSFDVYTKWIEQEWMETNPIEPYAGDTDADEDTTPSQKVVVEIDGRRVEVALPGDLALGGGNGGAKKKKSKKRRGGGKAVSGDAVVAPMQGTIIKVNVEEGQEVQEGETVVVLEAMKMENPVKATKSGTVTGLDVEEGKGVSKGDPLMELK
ncbi:MULTISPECIES: acetyl/propionyl/methylcrotonyl-CoA carboxylase subunit alpha [Corynebacterium]|uniref:acetyl/propionyl/methylcrotonyl-CoA carboxylase subunit alpha n=1 Tax=Corynebacterium TaxID=1716 RepID=UPI00061992A9|nr:biotin carboxylase N-terminal domain-containing protein [uncultured Corynebacterium sp.]MCF6778689.1 ATP-grasp domain-containing protein [Corynebacterium parakroppenstedtii]MCZ9302477.1 ATP-grasp domain-containing protein [Corynebacterium sp. c24U_166]MDU3197189.1 biotin carboxylase N-terminal domain-containing protein [Corynebacterium kroppenstedtii]MCF6784647.1 ATP-grasp domain-containing protein [Corynebacterium parakroppenstedtii]MCF6788312.1 ATP-grasp domain-containing protein [Coryneb